MNLHLLLVLALCALLAQPAQAQAQAEPEAARSDSLSEHMEAYGTGGTYEYTETELRITKKVVAGTASGVVFAVLGAKAYEDEGFGHILVGVLIGSTVGFPLGVTLVDPYDSFAATLMGGIIGGIIPVVGPIIGSLYASEKSRQPPSAETSASSVESLRRSASSAEPSKPQDCRVAFILAPTFNGGLSAIARIRF